MSLAADIGTLQRFPKKTGNDSLLRELAMTARDFGSDEALQLGLVSRVFSTEEEMNKYGEEVAERIAGQS
jgi:Delta3,5-Delta2,4-dienoyl-CoA isomerase